MLDTLYRLSGVAYFSCYPYTMLILEVSPSKVFKSIISAPLLDETCDSINTNKIKISFNYIIKDKLSGHLKVKKKKDNKNTCSPSIPLNQILQVTH